MYKIQFHKFTGAGNDFIFIDLNKNPNFNLSEVLIKKLCNRYFGIGADGVVIIEDSLNADFSMKYFNSDGSSGRLCANAARCAIIYSKISQQNLNNYVKFFCDGIEYSGEILDNDLIKFNLQNPTEIQLNFFLEINGFLLKSSFVDTGSPHLVINISDILQDKSNPTSFYNDLENFPLLELGRKLRYHSKFSPTGTNVNFYYLSEDEIIIRTYEKGVEGETLACGTGAVATALVCFLNDKKIPPIKFRTWGGDSLIVNFNIEKNIFYNFALIGPAKLIYTGEIII